MYKAKQFFIILIYLLWVCMLSACASPATLEAPQAPAAVSATPPPSDTPQPPTAALPARTDTPTAQASATPLVCSGASRQEGQVGVGLLDKPMDYYVILPPCYREERDRRYPVLYLLHGQNFDREQWLRLGLAGHAERLMLDGAIPPFIIVLPYDHSFKQPREYRFEEVFLSQLLPAIDRDYRILSERAARAVGGLSRGGAWAIYLASRHPDLFGIVGAHSPAVFYSNNSILPVRLRDIPPEQRPVFYVDAGDKDIEFREIKKFIGLLNDYGYPHEWHANLGFHDEKYWSAHVEEYLRWYGEQFRLAQ